MPSSVPTPVWEFDLFEDQLNGTQFIMRSNFTNASVSASNLFVLSNFDRRGRGARRLQNGAQDTNLTDEECVELWTEYVQNQIFVEIEDVIKRYELLEVEVTKTGDDQVFDPEQTLVYVVNIKTRIRNV